MGEGSRNIVGLLSIDHVDFKFMRDRFVSLLMLRSLGSRCHFGFYFIAGKANALMGFSL
jgi:hypothetical protein